MKSEEIRKKFLDFFESRNHKIVGSSSLVPKGDSSVLFTTAGMQQFKGYYVGTKDPLKDFGTKNTVSIQKCVRTSDIEEVGDERHLTFFEMLGNFSFGGYWKKEAIQYAYDFVTKEMNLKIDYVTVFKGEEGVPEDKESEEIWKSVDAGLDVRREGLSDNFWGPTGSEGPCGPTTEIYVDGIEIWNIVFNEFFYAGSREELLSLKSPKKLEPLKTPGIDTGMGLERLIKVVQKVPSVFETDLFKNVIQSVGDLTSVLTNQRILADHFRTSVNMIFEGLRPTNTGAGYILRRLLRRILIKTDARKIEESKIGEITKSISTMYPEIAKSLSDINSVILEELKIFERTLDRGTKELQAVFQNIKKIEELTAQKVAEELSKLFLSYGYPLELSLEGLEWLSKKENFNFNFSKQEIENEFWLLMEKHMQVSKIGMEKKFKGGLSGHGEMEVKYHTATHLLHRALRDVLGKHVEQRGSNITPERLRFDFSHNLKMTEEEIKKVESLVNEKIQENLPVQQITMPKDEAEKSGALHFFGEKYGDEISIYFIGLSIEKAYSKEFCGGPHATSTGVLGKFKIVKEEAVSAGVRRIKAILE